MGNVSDEGNDTGQKLKHLSAMRVEVLTKDQFINIGQSEETVISPVNQSWLVCIISVKSSDSIQSGGG